MKEIDLNWQRTIKIWRCIFWRSVVAGGIAAAIMGFLVALIAAIAGVPEEIIMMLIQVTSTVVGALVGIVVVWSALRKEYSDFRIALVPKALDPLSDTGQESSADPR